MMLSFFKRNRLNVNRFRQPFQGGIHPRDYKNLSSGEAIDQTFWPRDVYLPLQLRNGARLDPLVKVGDTVMRGQKIAEGRTEMIAPIHASVNGMVTAITDHMTSHPAKMSAETIIIRANEDHRWGETHPMVNIEALSETDILQRIQAAGIVGLGGAGFPTSAKLMFARRAGVHTLIINGGECEPYLTCDDLTMQTYAAEIISGIKIMLKVVGASQALVGIEDNKRAAFSQMKEAASESPEVAVVSVPSIYPMGSEKHMIKALTGLEVPQGGLSTQIGLLVNNIATARAVYHAVRFQRPLVSRVVTVSGKGIVRPCNLEIPVGSLVKDVLSFCGGWREDTERLIMGGPMMGQVITSLDVPIDKCTGGVLALTEDEVVNEALHQECIRCGQCVRACPMGLMPFQMAASTRVNDFKQTEALGVKNCLSCGACSYVCPSHIPLVHYFMHAKGVMLEHQRKEKKSMQAKALTEARKMRLEKEAAAKKADKAKRSTRPARPARPPRKPPETQTQAQMVSKSSPAEQYSPAKQNKIVKQNDMIKQNDITTQRQPEEVSHD